MADDTPLTRSKRPASILAGPYGHPFHPLLVTIPIGTWAGAFVFDLVVVFGGDPRLGVASAWLLVVGLVGALGAIVTGLLDFSRLTPGTRARSMAVGHLVINLVVVVLMTCSALVRFGGQVEHINGLGIALSTAGLLLLGVSGFLGGELAYRHGVRVAAEDDQRAGHTVETR